MEFLQNSFFFYVFTALAVVLAIFAVRSLTSKLALNQGKKKRKYHPIGGTVFNQLVNFNRLHHYMTDLASKHRTYRLLGPFRNEVYTADPVNVEHILKTNFQNYGKVPLFLALVSLLPGRCTTWIRDFIYLSFFFG